MRGIRWLLARARDALAGYGLYVLAVTLRDRSVGVGARRGGSGDYGIDPDVQPKLYDHEAEGHLGRDEEHLDEDYEPLESQVERLAQVIMHEIPNEPSQSEGAIDCAIRLLRQRQRVLEEEEKDAMQIPDTPYAECRQPSPVDDEQQCRRLAGHTGVHRTGYGSADAVWVALDRHTCHVTHPDHPDQPCALAAGHVTPWHSSVKGLGQLRWPAVVNADEDSSSAGSSSTFDPASTDPRIRTSELPVVSGPVVNSGSGGAVSPAGGDSDSDSDQR